MNTFFSKDVNLFAESFDGINYSIYIMDKQTLEITTIFEDISLEDVQKYFKRD